MGRGGQPVQRDALARQRIQKMRQGRRVIRSIDHLLLPCKPDPRLAADLGDRTLDDRPERLIEHLDLDRA